MINNYGVYVSMVTREMYAHGMAICLHDRSRDRGPSSHVIRGGSRICNRRGHTREDHAKNCNHPPPTS